MTGAWLLRLLHALQRSRGKRVFLFVTFLIPLWLLCLCPILIVGEVHHSAAAMLAAISGMFLIAMIWTWLLWMIIFEWN